MPDAIRLQPLTPLESFSIAGHFTQKLSKCNKTVSQRLLTRIIGCVLVAFAALSDAVIHAALTLGKAVVALPALAFKCCFHPPRDLEIASAFVHLTRTIYSLFNIAILPFLCLLDPQRAYLIASLNSNQERRIPTAHSAVVSSSQLPDQDQDMQTALKIRYEQQEKELNELKDQSEKNKAKIVELQEDIKTKQNELNLRDNEIGEITKNKETAEKRLAQLEILKDQEINLLQDQRKILGDQVNAMKKGLNGDHFETAKQVVALDHQQDILNLKQQLMSIEKERNDAQEEIKALSLKITALENEKVKMEKQILDEGLQLQKLNDEKVEINVKFEDLTKYSKELLALLNLYMNDKPKIDEKLNEILECFSPKKMAEVEIQKQPQELKLQDQNHPPRQEDALENIEVNLLNEGNGIINELEKNESQEEGQQPSDKNAFYSEEARQIASNTHAQLMEAIKNFANLKKDHQDPLRKVDKIGMDLKPKDKKRIDLFFSRKSLDGLRRISRYVKNIYEFCQHAQEFDVLNYKTLEQSTIEFNQSLINGLKHADDSSNELRKVIEYLENYLSYLQPHIGQLVDEQKKKKDMDDRALEEKQKEEALAKEEEERKKQGLLTKEEALPPLELKKGIVKKFQDEPGENVDVLSDLSGIKKTKAETHFCEKSNRKIKNLEEFNSKLDEIKKSINKVEKFYKPTQEYKLVKEIVEWLNDREYMPKNPNLEQLKAL